jgi:hypothetical protein
MRSMNPWLAEAVGLLAQAGVFVVGLALSLVIGMVLAAHLDGPGGLLFATVLSGAGLLGSAALSQTLRDYLVQRGIED